MFERWVTGNKDNESGHMFIRFSSTKQLHLSSALTSAIQREWKKGPPDEVGAPAFNIYVDSKKRLIGISPVGCGDFALKDKTLPPVFGAAPLVDQYNPVKGRLYVRYLKKDKVRPGMWVANMDGKEAGL